MLGTSAPFIRWKRAIGVDLAFEAIEEGLAGWPGAGAAVGGPAPGDFGSDLLVDVLHCQALTSLSSVESWAAPFLSLWVAGVCASASRKRLPICADAREACACACATGFTERHFPDRRRARSHA